MKILITGGTGFLGKQIGAQLANANHQLFLVTRNIAKARLACNFACEFIEGHLDQEPLRDRSLSQIEAVIHLAGESIIEGKWTAERKNEIYKSRVQSTKNLIASLASAPLKVFISTSACGIYGDRGNESLNEDSIPGSGFLAELCRDWERAAEVASQKGEINGARLVIFRLPMVLSKSGGAMVQLLPIFKFGLGGPIGQGERWQPWVHGDDVVSLYCKALTEVHLRGIYNVVAPEILTNMEFSKKLAFHLKRKTFLATPPVLLKFFFGELADEIFLTSQNVASLHLKEPLFDFAYPTLDQAFAEILGPRYEK